MGEMTKFIAVTNGNYKEIIRAENIVKIFKGEGKDGTEIYYEFYRIPGEDSIQWVEDFPSTEARDIKFDHLVEILNAG